MLRFFCKSVSALVVALVVLLQLAPRTFAQTGSWMIVSIPSVPGATLSGVAAVSASDIWAVGGQGPNQVNETSLIEHWNGTAWSVVANPGTVSLSGVTALAPNNVWAVGRTGSDGTAEILHWNGTRWSVVPSARPPTYGDILRLSAVTAISANDIWAVGIDFFTTGEGDTTNRSLAEHWNGSTWSIAGAPAPVVGGGHPLTGVATLPSTDASASPAQAVTVTPH